MREREAAKAKTLVIGATIKKAAAASASSGGSSKASGSEASKKTDAAGGLSASLLVSASMASTVKIQSDSDKRLVKIFQAAGGVHRGTEKSKVLHSCP